jgi:hypothetical protein
MLLLVTLFDTLQMSELMPNKSDKACMSLIQNILSVALVLPVTWKALTLSQAPFVLLKGLKDQLYLGVYLALYSAFTV